MDLSRVRSAPHADLSKALGIQDLSVSYRTESGDLPAVRGVSLDVSTHQSLGLVGESGCGKTTLALGAIGYLPDNGRVTSGSAWLGNVDMLGLSRPELRRVWGSRVGLVSQNPQGAFNPSLTIGRQLDEMGRRHLGLGRRDARESTLSMLAKVDMPDSRSVVARYPHQLSGGMLQRAAIAMALLTNPQLLVLDEPTTALDVTTQALVLDLLEGLKSEFNTASIYITHNLGVVARICDRVAVMYAGEILEEAPVADIFAQPLHPYTLNLLNCVPRFGVKSPGSTPLGAAVAGTRLASIPGSLPLPGDLPPGCAFAPRCALAVDLCRLEHPPLAEVALQRASSCWRWELLLSEEGRRAAASGPEEPEPVRDQTGPETPTAPAARAGGDTLPTPDRPPDTGLVETRALTKEYAGPGSKLSSRVVDKITLRIDASETLGLVGESGSGKTTLARMTAGLTPPTSGSVLMDGQTLEPAADRRHRAVLRRLQMVFQNPDASLNPRRTVGEAIMRPLRVLQHADRAAATSHAHRLLEAVRLPAEYFNRYPAELSGGEKQRVAIARAFAASPDLVICDEPISSLDVSVQGSLMNLLLELQEERGTSYLFISHDMAAVQHLSSRIAVMYLGRLMEQGEASRVLAPPYHPYTEALLSAIPVPDPGVRRTRARLRSGESRSGGLPSGCRFHPRCPRFLGPLCAQEEPPWRFANIDVEETGPGTPGAAAATADHAICCHIPLDELFALQRPKAEPQEDRP